MLNDSTGAERVARDAAFTAEPVVKSLDNVVGMLLLLVHEYVVVSIHNLTACSRSRAVGVGPIDANQRTPGPSVRAFPPSLVQEQLFNVCFIDAGGCDPAASI